MNEAESPVFRPAGISYVRIPAENPQETAAFYERVFGWTVDAARPQPSFEDGSGHVIGHFISDVPVAGEAGVRPYIYVDSVEDAIKRITANGGSVVQAPYPEGDLWGGHLPRSGRKHRRYLAARTAGLRFRPTPSRRDGQLHCDAIVMSTIGVPSLV